MTVVMKNWDPLVSFPEFAMPVFDQLVSGFERADLTEEPRLAVLLYCQYDVGWGWKQINLELEVFIGKFLSVDWGGLVEIWGMVVSRLT
jgi:hypothetical protein